MPELPEVETLKNGIKPALEGSTVTYLKFYRDNLRFEIPKIFLKKILLGEKVTDVSRRSKYILIKTKVGYAIIHLGMTGNVLYQKDKKPSKKHTHFVIGIENRSGEKEYFHYVDPRRFGFIDALMGDEVTDHPMIERLGPEPLEEKNLAKHLYKKGLKKKIAIKKFIMDASIVVGVGNIYASESLFDAGVLPTRLTCDLELKEYQAISRSIKKILKRAIKAGGTTLQDFKNLQGESGYFEISLKAYGREGKKCSNCKHIISKTTLSGRSTFFCKNCQV